MKSILLSKKNRRSKKTRKIKSVSFRKKIIEEEILIPRVGKSKKVNPYKQKLHKI